MKLRQVIPGGRAPVRQLTPQGTVASVEQGSQSVPVSTPAVSGVSVSQVALQIQQAIQDEHSERHLPHVLSILNF